jgi:chorismate mutase
MRFVLPVFVMLVSVLPSGCAWMQRGSPTLSMLMVQRLDWMDEVAEAKRAKGLPIHDPKREAELLHTMTERGMAAGLKAESVRLFFSGQMQAAKLRQEEWLRQHPTATTAKAPDLATTIRPALDQIGTKMIERLAQETRGISSIDAQLIETEARERLARAGCSEAVARPALQGLRAALRQLAHEPTTTETKTATATGGR